jgi:hypothetical protein
MRLSRQRQEEIEKEAERNRRFYAGPEHAVECQCEDCLDDRQDARVDQRLLELKDGGQL